MSNVHVRLFLFVKKPGSTRNRSRSDIRIGRFPFLEHMVVRCVRNGIHEHVSSIKLDSFCDPEPPSAVAITPGVKNISCLSSPAPR